MRFVVHRSLSKSLEGFYQAPYLHPTPCTLHPTPYTLHHTPYTLHPTPHTLHPTPYTLHPTPCTPHPTHFTLHPAPCTLQTTHYLHHKLYMLHPTPCTLHPTPCTQDPTPCTLHITYTLHPEPYAPHPIHRTLHPTPYTITPPCLRKMLSKGQTSFPQSVAQRAKNNLKYLEDLRLNQGSSQGQNPVQTFVYMPNSLDGCSVKNCTQIGVIAKRILGSGSEEGSYLRLLDFCITQL